MIKKISLGFLTALLLAFMMGAQALAAQGEVQFSDPQTSVGEEFEITAKMTCGGVLIGDGELTLNYDPAYLEFVEGTGSKDESEGSVTLFNAGTGTETELDYTIKFKALQQGETVVEVVDSEAYLWNNATLHLTLGTSTVTIGEGDGNAAAGGTPTAKGDGPEVTIDGVKYNIVNEIPPVIIPEGFTVVSASFEGENVNALQQDASGQQAFCVTDGKEAKLFLYSGEDGKFTPLELVQISETAYIILLRDDGGAEVPKGFKEATLTYNDQEFPVWQNPEQEDFYLVYALNSAGEKAMYLYDKRDETYQRYNPDLLSNKPAAKKTSKSSGLVGTLLDFIENHLKPFLIAIGALLLLLLIWALVLKRKVHNREVEIDDLYDELDGRKAGKVAGPRGSVTEDFSGVLPYDDDLFGEEAFDAYNNTFEFDDDDDFINDYTGTLPVKLTDTLAKHKPLEANRAPARKAKKTQVKPLSNRKFHVDEDDTFKLDFIDFDE